MKKLQWILCIVLAAIGFFSFNQQVTATLSISGDVITDSDTGLDWLVMSRTTNKSPNEIMNRDGEFAKEGWVYATQQQVETLFRSAGWTGELMTWTSANYVPARSLAELIGPTYVASQGTIGTQALSAPTAQMPGWFPIGFIAYTEADRVGGGGFYGAFSSDFKSPGFGSWLVRGNLPINAPPEATPTGGGEYELFSSVLIGGQVSDLDGDRVDVTWREGLVEIAYFQVETIKGGSPVDIPTISISSTTGGIHYLTLEVCDRINPPIYREITVAIIDSTAPILAPVPDKPILWPPNRKMVDVTIAANASDNSGGPVFLEVMVWSNEPGQGLYDNPVSPDWTVPQKNQETGTIALKLRATRCNDGSPRIYTIRITALDDYGNYTVVPVEITVPHDKRK